MWSPFQPLILDERKITGTRSFKTRVVTQVMENGPTPDTAAFIQKVEEVSVLSFFLNSTTFTNTECAFEM
jgi:hypothetical protein